MDLKKYLNLLLLTREMPYWNYEYKKISIPLVSKAEKRFRLIH